MLARTARRTAAARRTGAACAGGGAPRRLLAKKKKMGSTKIGMAKKQKEVEKERRANEASDKAASVAASKPFLPYRSFTPQIVKFMDGQDALDEAPDERSDEQKAADREITDAHVRENARRHGAHAKQMMRMSRAKARAIDMLPDGYLREHALTWDMSVPPELNVPTDTPMDPEIPYELRLVRELHTELVRDHLLQMGDLDGAANLKNVVELELENTAKAAANAAADAPADAPAK